jgi:hypothetical protein
MPGLSESSGTSKYFYFDDVPGRRVRRDMLSSEHALECAKGLARAER